MSAPAVAGAKAATANPEHPSTDRRARVLGYALLAALSYVPLLMHATGRVVVDTKSYLYLDAGRVLERALSMWSPHSALGTVTHQDIGYLFPAGPFYWLLDQLGSPMWVAQRLWLGSILFAAGLGVLFLLRTLNIRGPGVVVAALLYMLSPYVLQYASRISILLLAWSALPWLIAITARALRDDAWRYPAIFAIVVQVAGSVNATALILAGIAPLLWIAHSVWVTHEVTLRRALRVTGRIALLSFLASLWWIVSLIVEGGYGLNVLEFTETIAAVSTTGLTAEVMRGLGYWFFYGGDRIDLWVKASIDYTQRRWLLATTYAFPVLALLSAAFIRWRHRVYFVALILVGVAIGVGTHPYNDPSPFGAAVKAFGEGSTIGLALRSVGRAVPLVILGLAVLLGLGANLLTEWLAARGRARVGYALCAALGVLAIINLPGLWTGSIYGENLQRDEDLPDYWVEAISALDRRPADTRILELPGADFAAYRWGTTIVPITPALTDRPYVARELTLAGSEASVDLMAALDRRVQLGLLDPDSVAPIAALLSAGDVVLRDDLEVDRFDLVRPRELWSQFRSTPEGLEDPTAYGDDLGRPLTFAMLDARELSVPNDVETPAPVVVFPVSDTRPLVRAASTDGIVIVAGNGDGLVDLAGAGAISSTDLIQYAASYGHDRDALDKAVDGAAVIVITDSNRKRAQHWDNLRDTVGYTESGHERPLTKDTADHRLKVFPQAGPASFTTMEQFGARVSATSYGTKTTLLPADRPARALDGDLTTAWRVGALGPVDGERIRVELEDPVTADEINLVQPLVGARNRYITRAELRFRDANGKRIGRNVRVGLGDDSRAASGQTVSFPRRRFSTIEIVVRETNVGSRSEYPHDSAVGLAEIRIPDSAGSAARVREVVHMPSDVVSTPAARSTERALVYEMTRLRNLIAAPNIAEEEAAIVRSFIVPSGRDFALRGTARLSAATGDGTPAGAFGLDGVSVQASEHLRTSVRAQASSAFDGDPETAWSTELGDPTGEWLELESSEPITLDHLDLTVVADGRHSVPTRLQIESAGVTRTVEVPAVTDRQEIGATVQQTVRFDPLTGDRIRITVEAVRPVTTIEYYQREPITLPVAIAEVEIAGEESSGSIGALPSTCRDDLVTVDGAPVPVRLVGSGADAVDGRGFTVEACAPVPMDAGGHVVRARPGTGTGIDIDQLILASGRDGAPLVADASGSLRLIERAERAPRIEVTELGSTAVDARVRETGDEPFWLVFGESFNKGWHAEVNGRDLGAPRLVDGMANGWLVEPHGDATLAISLRWKPQSWIWIGLAVSAIALVGCLVLAFRRRRGTAAADVESPPAFAPPLESDGREPTRRALVTTVAGMTLTAGLLVTPWAGVVVGALTIAVLHRPRWRPLLAFGAPLAMFATGAYIVIQQSRVGYPPVFEWPAFFDDVHVLGWFAVMLLTADAVVEYVRTRPTSPQASLD